MSSRCPHSVRTAFVLMGVWLAAYELHALLGLPGAGFLFGRFAHSGLLLVATGCCAARAVYDEHERAAWALIACAMLSWALGDLYLTAAYPGAQEVPIPSPADIGFIGVYPFAFAGLVLLLRARTGRVGATVWIDGLIAALVTAAYAAAIVVDQIVNTVGGQPASVATNLAYPLGDMLLMGVIIAGFAVARWRPDRGWWLLGVALLLFWIGDSIYLVASAQGSHTQGGQLDVIGWVVFVLLALAAWQEPATRLRRTQSESLRTITVPVGFALLGLALLLAGTLRPISTLAAMLAAVSLVAVLLRLAITFREKLQLLGDTREQAMTDALTGLGNRRRLLADLAERGRAPAARFQLALFDLDGFKDYNDRFGHPAGDVVLAGAGARLAAAVAPYGTAYRMGGDEFCAIVDCDERDVERVIDTARSSLESHGEGFTIRSSSGVARIPADGQAASEVLRVADARLYDEKRVRGEQPREQATSALVQVIRELDPARLERVARLVRLARAVAAQLSLPAHEIEDVVRAAELSSIGERRAADRNGRRGTRVGGSAAAAERIIAAAPSSLPSHGSCARRARSSTALESRTDSRDGRSRAARASLRPAARSMKPSGRGHTARGARNGLATTRGPPSIRRSSTRWPRRSPRCPTSLRRLSPRGARRAPSGARAGRRPGPRAAAASFRRRARFRT